MISGEWVKLKTWHFILEPAKSTKTVEQSVTGLLAEDNAGFSGRRKAAGESGDGQGNTRLCLSVDLPGQARQGVESGWASAPCSHLFLPTQAVPPPTPEAAEILLLIFGTVEKAPHKGGLW